MILPGSPISTEHILRVCEPRWIDQASAERACLRTVDSVTGGQLVGRNGAGQYEGIAIPLRWPGDSDYIREWILRRDHPEFEQKADGIKKRRGKYLYPPGRGNLLYVPADAEADLLTDTSVPVWITEGPLKALALWRAAWFGFGDAAEKPRALAVGINGVWGFRGIIGKENDADGIRVDLKGTIPDFSRIECRERLTIVCFDPDLKDNRQVSAARREFTRVLHELGATVAWFPWPKTLPAGVNGIDDFLAACGPDKTLKLISGARVQRRKASGITAEPKAGVFALTEMGNAERLVKGHGVNFRYVGSTKKFIAHDGQRYVDDDLGQMARWAKATVRSIYREAAAQGDDAVRIATAEWAKRSEKGAQITAMLKLAASEPGVAVLPAQLDTDPWLLNVANGTIDLRTGTRRPHRREDLITKLAPVKYDPGAKCPRWLQFLGEVFEPHPDVPNFLQLFAGYSLTADTREECMLLLHGAGRNGKGTLLKTLAAALGDYATTADFSTFIAVRDDRGPRDDIANLRGSRMVSAQEGRDGAVLAESIVKWLTGGDRLRARLLHENSYEITPTWKFWLSSNYKPVIRGTDPAIWSRIRLVPFDVCFEGREDRTLKITLMDELPGVLAWAVEGCLRWQKVGLPLPESVLKATGDYRSESDVIGRFIEESCVVAENFSVQSRVLYREYQAWAQATGEHDVLTETAFGLRLSGRFKKEHTERGQKYSGIGLRLDK